MWLAGGLGVVYKIQGLHRETLSLKTKKQNKTKQKKNQKTMKSLGMVVHAFNFTAQEAEVGTSL